MSWGPSTRFSVFTSSRYSSSASCRWPCRSKVAAKLALTCRTSAAAAGFEERVRVLGAQHALLRLRADHPSCTVHSAPRGARISGGKLISARKAASAGVTLRRTCFTSRKLAVTSRKLLLAASCLGNVRAWGGPTSVSCALQVGDRWNRGSVACNQ